jgi:hypothetical protein
MAAWTTISRAQIAVLRQRRCIYTTLYVEDMKCKYLRAYWQTIKYRWLTVKWQTRPLVREGGPQRHDSNRQTVTDIWSWEPEGARNQDILTDWLTISRNVTLTVSWQGVIARVSQHVGSHGWEMWVVAESHSQPARTEAVEHRLRNLRCWEL